jgi:GT2 family glycosyltransferase
MWPTRKNGSGDVSNNHVTAVVVSYNSGHVIEACLKRLLQAGAESRGPQVRIVVVDNNSTDNTVEVVTAVSADIQVIQNDKNLGFARAVNIGCREVNDEAILLINPDAVLETGALSLLLEELVHTPDLAACAPLTVDPRTYTRYLPAGRLPTLWPMACYASGLAHLADRIPMFRGHYRTLPDVLAGATEVEWASAGCLLVRTSAWHRVGGFSERWFMYGEDVDLSFRLTESGYRIRIVPAATVVHESGTGSRDHDGQTSARWLTNLGDFYGRSLAPHPVALTSWRLLMGTGFLLRAFVLWLLPRRSTPQRRRHDLARYHRYAQAMFRKEPPWLNTDIESMNTNITSGV